jgi:hypothetical protein
VANLPAASFPGAGGGMRGKYQYISMAYVEIRRPETQSLELRAFPRRAVRFALNVNGNIRPRSVSLLHHWGIFSAKTAILLRCTLIF